jgi:peptide chain release factor 1
MDLLEKIRNMEARLEELALFLSQPDAMSDPKRWRDALKEHADLEEIDRGAKAYLRVLDDIASAKEALESGDEELEELAREELAELEPQAVKLEEEVRLAFVPKDPNDDKNVILEIRAGTGGEEAALFAMDLLKMYTRYAEGRGYQMEVTSLSETELGGCVKAVCMISGKGAFSRLKFESGAHRVQRVPETESGGRIHTSAATVAVLPEAEEVDVQIDPKDLRIDLYRASGAGGQHVNRTDSAVRLTHLPTGIVVECQDERSQIKNKDKAMRVLRSRVKDYYQGQVDAEYEEQRRSRVGSGDRSERIRTYNFPQNRVTDHRIGLTLYHLDTFLQGAMDEMLDALILADRTERLQRE